MASDWLSHNASAVSEPGQLHQGARAPEPGTDVLCAVEIPLWSIADTDALSNMPGWRKNEH